MFFTSILKSFNRKNNQVNSPRKKAASETLLSMGLYRQKLDELSAKPDTQEEEKSSSNTADSAGSFLNLKEDIANNIEVPLIVINKVGESSPKKHPYIP